MAALPLTLSLRHAHPCSAHDAQLDVDTRVCRFAFYYFFFPLSLSVLLRIADPDFAGGSAGALRLPPPHAVNPRWNRFRKADCTKTIRQDADVHRRCRAQRIFRVLFAGARESAGPRSDRPVFIHRAFFCVRVCTRPTFQLATL